MNTIAQQHNDPDPHWAWAPYSPTPDRPWTPSLAAHLYRRAAFGPRWTDLQQALEDGPQRTVDHLLTPPPENESSQEHFDDFDRASARGNSVGGLCAWWLRRMIESPDPLRERLTLIWQNHFAIPARRVQSAQLVIRYQHTLRQHALANYGNLLGAVLNQPAAYLGLGAAQNRKSQPSLHLARWLTEDITLGPGVTQPQDLENVARAMTGWFVLNRQLRFIDREHDTADKTILGRTDCFERDTLVHFLTSRPATAKHIVRVLYREFISEANTPTDATLAPLVQAFSRSGNLRELVDRILRSNLFFSDASLHHRVKSPVELAVGALRSLETTVPTLPLAQDLARMGQDLYHPPTLSGWPRGKHWITATSLVQRRNLATDLLDPSSPYQGRMDPEKIATQHADASHSPDSILRHLLAPQSSGPDSPTARGSQEPEDLRQLALYLMTQAEFQLC